MVFVTVVKEQASDKQGMEEFVLLIDEMIQEKSIKGIEWVKIKSL